MYPPHTKIIILVSLEKKMEKKLSDTWFGTVPIKLEACYAVWSNPQPQIEIIVCGRDDTPMGQIFTTKPSQRMGCRVWTIMNLLNNV